MEKNYYVYIYLNPIKPGNYIFNDLKFNFEPFYIGKGKGYRITSHLQSILNKWNYHRNILKTNEINEILNNNEIPIIYKIYDNMTEDSALDKEKELIETIGRIVTKSGPLTNITNGGEHNTLKNHPERNQIIEKIRKSKLGKKLSDDTKNRIRENHQTDDYRKKISEKMINYFSINPISDETKQKISENLLNKKIIRSDETKQKISKSNKNRKHTKKSRKNMSNAHIGIDMPKRVKYTLVSPENIEYEFIGEKYLFSFVNNNDLSLRLLQDNINKGKIKIKRKTKKSIKTEGWIIQKHIL